MNLARCFDQLGQDGPADEAFAKAIDTAKNLADSASESDQQKLLQYANTIAGFQLKTGHHLRGIEFLKVCQSLFVKLAEAKPEVRRYRKDQAVCHIRIGNAYLQVSSQALAQVHFGAALEVLSGLQEAGPLDSNEEKMVQYCRQHTKKE